MLKGILSNISHHKSLRCTVINYKFKVTVTLVNMNAPITSLHFTVVPYSENLDFKLPCNHGDQDQWLKGNCFQANSNEAKWELKHKLHTSLDILDIFVSFINDNVFCTNIEQSLPHISKTFYKTEQPPWMASLMHICVLNSTSLCKEKVSRTNENRELVLGGKCKEILQFVSHFDQNIHL